jgi:hypothetical protein
MPSSSLPSDIRIAENPRHFIVLYAISRRIASVSEISRVTKLDKAEVRLIICDLNVQRLITLETKSGPLGKRIYACINNIGSKLLYEKKQELEQKARDLRGWYYGGDRKMTQSFMEDNRAWIPMMIFSGILNALFFVSMMSSMGMAMNPMESLQISSALARWDTEGAAAEGDIHSAADDVRSSLGAWSSLGKGSIHAPNDEK